MFIRDTNNNILFYGASSSGGYQNEYEIERSKKR